MHVTGRNLAFALANTIAVLVALYIAFASNLERPYWAMLTVFIVDKPNTGAVRSKAPFRLLGTLAGAAMALLLVPPGACKSNRLRISEVEVVPCDPWQTR